MVRREEITSFYMRYPARIYRFKASLLVLVALLLQACMAPSQSRTVVAPIGDDITVDRQGLRALVDESCHNRMRILTRFNLNELTEDEVVEFRQLQLEGYQATFEKCQQGRRNWLRLQH